MPSAQQRGQDQSGMALGANLYNMGVQGPWNSIGNANNIYNNYSGLGSGATTSTSQGGGGMGMVGGAIGGAQMYNNLYGSGSNTNPYGVGRQNGYGSNFNNSYWGT